MYRSPLKMQHDALGANWTEHCGLPIVANYGESPERRQRVFEGLAVADLSGLPRLGIKGADLSRWSRANAYSIGDAPNKAYVQSDGQTVWRLSATELLLLANINAPTVVAQPTFVDDHRCYTIRRQDSHVWLAIAGRNSAALLAKICGVDLSSRKFPDLSLAQTSLARVSALILRHDLAENPIYHLLLDCSCANYMWDCLQDAAAEFDGQAVGLQAFQTTSVGKRS